MAGLPSRVASAELASSRLRSESGMNASGGVAFTPLNCPARAGAGTGASWYDADAASGKGTSSALLPDLEAALSVAACCDSRCCDSRCCALRGVLGALAATAPARIWWTWRETAS